MTSMTTPEKVQAIIDEIYENYGEWIEMHELQDKYVMQTLAILLINERKNAEFYKRMYESTIRRVAKNA